MFNHIVKVEATLQRRVFPKNNAWVLFLLPEILVTARCMQWWCKQNQTSLRIPQLDFVVSEFIHRITSVLDSFNDSKWFPLNQVTEIDRMWLSPSEVSCVKSLTFHLVVNAGHSGTVGRNGLLQMCARSNVSRTPGFHVTKLSLGQMGCRRNFFTVAKQALSLFVGTSQIVSCQVVCVHCSAEAVSVVHW